MIIWAAKDKAELYSHDDVTIFKTRPRLAKAGYWYGTRIDILTESDAKQMGIKVQRGKCKAYEIKEIG